MTFAAIIRSYSNKKPTMIYNRLRSLSPMKPDTEVWVKRGDKKTKGTVLTAAATPRFYIVATPVGQLHRNHHHLTTVSTDEKMKGTGNHQHEGKHDLHNVQLYSHLQRVAMTLNFYQSMEKIWIL